MSRRWRDAYRALTRVTRVLENALIVLLLSTLVVLASSQIVMRNVLSSSLPWGDELVRLLVLWLALVGAIAASRDGRQIRVDLLSRLVPERLMWIPESIASVFTAAVCGMLSWQSARFVLDSRAFGDRLLGNQPAWLLQIILPIGFAIIAYRYLIRAVAVPRKRR